jgi:hypothetical protein
MLLWQQRCKMQQDDVSSTKHRTTTVSIKFNWFWVLIHVLHIAKKLELLGGCIQKFPDWVDNEIYAYLWYYSLRSNTKSYDGKTHYTDSQSSDTTEPRGGELYHLQLSLQAASPKTFEYILVR